MVVVQQVFGLFPVLLDMPVSLHYIIVPRTKHSSLYTRWCLVSCVSGWPRYYRVRTVLPHGLYLCSQLSYVCQAVGSGVGALDSEFDSSLVGVSWTRCSSYVLFDSLLCYVMGGKAFSQIFSILL